MAMSVDEKIDNDGNIEKRGLWGIVERNKIFDNRGLRVFLDEVITPNGSKGQYRWIDMREGVNILPVGENWNVVLGEDFQYAIGKQSREIFGGAIKENELELEAAKRELKEEAGLLANEWIYVGISQPMTGVINTKIHLYIARGLRKTETNQDDTENIKCVEISLDEAINEIYSGKITDTQTQTLLLCADRLRRNGSL